jgi:predicted ATPase/class 3 adenylate cyclase
MIDLPDGIITFLFTDIEGSTRLWEHDPEVMRESLIRHDQFIESIIHQHGGILVKPRGEGDSHFAVFARATEAVTTAVILQQLLVTEFWYADNPLKVRIALHTGEADLRDNDYYGTVVNRCARLRSIGHGGQILLSQATYELVRDDLPADVTLRYMGTHRLRDLQRPERVFQLLHPNLPAEFPPLRSLNTIPNNLPQQLTSFVGREHEMKEVIQLLKTTRLLTLTGTGGCGKTRLALQVSAELLENYPDGVWFIDLAPITDPNLIPQAVAKVLSVKEEAGRPLPDTLLDFLKNKTTLLVFDNYEHLIVARGLLAVLLQNSNPTLQVLTTSREILSIVGEVVWRVPSLSTPSLNHLPPLESLTQYEAVRLFIERAMLARPSFTVTNANAPAVAQICQRLDGIPLAIELAAARVRILSVEQINQRLNERFRLLTGGSRNLLPRQQTLRALIDWGYNLLTVTEQQLFRRLSVFLGGWTLEAVETICTGDGIDELEVLDLLAALVDKSLVVMEEGEENRLRYRLLETLRQYGQEKLLAANEATEYERRYRSYFTNLVETAEPHLQGADAGFWLEQLDLEHNNLRSALNGYDSQNEAAAEVRLVISLAKFWILRGHWAEGRQWLEKVLKKALTKTAADRSTVLSELGDIAIRQGDYATARSVYEECLQIQRQLADQSGIAKHLFNVGTVALCQGDYVVARSFYEESLQIQRQLVDQPGIGNLLFTLGIIAENQNDFELAHSLYQESLERLQVSGDQYFTSYLLNSFGSLAEKQGDFETAQTFYQQSLEIRQQLGDRQGLAYSFSSFGTLAEKQGNYEIAQSRFQDALQIQRELGDQYGIALSLRNLGSVAERQNDLDRARAFYMESLQICQALQEKLGLAACLEGLARVLSTSHFEQAAQLFGAAATLREALSCPIFPLERDRHRQAVSTLQTQMGEDEFANAWAKGQTIALSTLMAEILNNIPQLP